jgi:hypothetical protein
LHMVRRYSSSSMTSWCSAAIRWGHDGRRP